ncbi:MAG: PSD1 and planctomycete cytochrome C domain-containing protein [Gemmataceae bacterium]|nr:PSD1 and planctomycete cytochrome C domain-containing protein [Gemmataceae bacterium]
MGVKRSRFLLGIGIGIVAVCVAAHAQPSGRDEAGRVAFFETKVRPLLVGHCYTCHSADTKPSGGLRVDDRTGLLAGGNTGPAVVPGEPAKSLLLARVTHQDAKRRMPQEGQPLTEAQIADLTTWIRDGAAWPAVNVPVSLGKPKPVYERLKKEHWAWQPLSNPQVPAVQEATWPRDDIDRFLLAKLEAKDLRPVGDADKVALLRRVTFDLTGLPPAPADSDVFLKDSSPDAYAKVVDRLLAAPQFGERWGRHWLDVARYGESTGPSRNIPYPHAWRYRDYVIAAVNADVPFDRFVQEQIAGDLLLANTSTERDRLLTATGFLALGVKDVNQRFKVRFVMDNVDEQIDAVTRSVLALTVSCARCHDHKFDPIPTTDYYALAGIFTSTDNCAGVRNKMGGGGLDYYDPSMLVTLSTDLPPVPTEQIEKRKVEVAEAKKAWDAIRGTPEGLAKGPDGLPKQRPYRLKYEQLQAELLALTDPAARGHAVHGVRDAKMAGDTEVRIRGQAEKLGPTVARGFLTAFEVPGAPKVNSKHSGRLELAQWLTSPQNPLTARVIVNRVWKHLFGQGIVTTVDNFGVSGATPSHPELLDHLANRFVNNGWSVKNLVRTLVRTRAYQLSAESTPAHFAADPANRLVWRHAPRRLAAEEVRDAMLVAAGTLNQQRPTGSPANGLKMIEMRDNGPEARSVHEHADQSTHRSVYLPLLRGVTPHALEAFDPVEQALVTGQRDATTVPSQALYLLNSSFVRRQALTLAEQLLQQQDATKVDRIHTAYRRTLGRVPTEWEVERARAFLAEYASDYRLVGTDVIQPKDARTAAWLAFAQALFGSAEFRYLP